MHHAYITSTLLSIGTHHGSISISSTDCSSNLFCERFGRTPFALSLPPSSHSHSPQCCSCCACCSCCGSPSLSNSSFAIKPSFLLYGLRQSSLIQCPPSRRMNLGGRTWCYDRVPGYGFDLGGYEVPCSFEESSGRERIGGRRKEVRPRPVNSQQRRRCLDSANDAEAVINLLSEEVSEEYLDHRRRIGEFSERLQKVRKGSYGGSECESQRNKNLRLRLLASKSRCEFESNTNEFKKEESRMKEERNEKKKKKDSRDVYRGENSKVRTGSASLSSYYSLSSEEEFENDEEVHEEEPSTGYMNELDESSSQGQVVGAFEKHPEDSEKQKEVSEHRTRVSSIEWDLRKKSEKKLTDFEETEYIKHSSQLQSRTDSTHEDNHMKSMNSGTKIDDFSHEYKVSDDKEESAVVVSQEKRATARYNQRGNNKVEKQAEVRRNSQQVTGRQDIHETDNGAASRYHRLSPGGEGMVGRSGKDRSSSSHELLKNTDMGNAGLGTVSTFQKQSESRTKTQEERKALSSYWEVSDKRDQIGPSKVMGEVESTMSSKQSPQMSEGHQQYRGKSYSQHSESEAKGQRFPRTDQKPLERVQSRKGPKDATNLTVNLTNVSLVNTSSNTETVVNSQRNSQQIIVNQGGDDTSTAKPIQETGARRSLLVHEPQGVRKTSSLCRRTSERASRPQTSEEAIERIRSEAVMVPPSHQLVARSSFREDPAGGVQVQDVSEGDMSDPGIRQEPQYGDLEEGGFNDNSLYLHNRGDVLGSARRQEESSMQYVGEFVERARHHEPSSEAEVSKGNNSRGSSADSGEKGPSDEIWDIRNPSVHEPPKAEAAEELQGSNEAGSSVVTERSAIRKTGKSMWAIIGDIVRLRWSSPRAETSKSTGGKTSSNDSAASEAWFSGRDPDERSEGTLKKETSSSDQVLLSHTSSQRRGEASDTGETKRMASPSIILKSGSTSRGFTSPAGEKDLDFSPEGKGSQVAPSSVRLGETPLISLPLSARSSPIVKPSLDTHKSDASASGSGEKDGEVKGRKLQRNKQVIRDRFDDWEEAYIHESEQRKIDEMFMREALVEAKKAADIWEVPVGAVLVQHGKIIARGYNLVEELRDSTAHAEMICIREGSNQLRSWRLAETTLYVTLEPCTMCAGAILQARIDTLVWGAPNKLLGADGSWIRIFPNGEGGSGLETDKPAPPVHPFHPKMTIRRGILAVDCADVMQSFFQLRRKTKINNSKEEQQQQHSPQNSLVRVSNHPSKILKKMHDIFHVMFCL